MLDLSVLSNIAGRERGWDWLFSTLVLLFRVYFKFGSVLSLQDWFIIEQSHQAMSKWDATSFQLTSGWGPYAYFRALEEMHSNSNSAHPLNGSSGQAMEAQTTNLQARPYRSPGLLPEAWEERLPFDDVEFGRRWFCRWVHAFGRLGCVYICS